MKMTGDIGQFNEPLKMNEQNKSIKMTKYRKVHGGNNITTEQITHRGPKAKKAIASRFV